MHHYTFLFLYTKPPLEIKYKFPTLLYLFCHFNTSFSLIQLASSYSHISKRWCHFCLVQEYGAGREYVNCYMLRSNEHFMTFITGFNFAGDFYSCTELCMGCRVASRCHPFWNYLIHHKESVYQAWCFGPQNHH